VTEPEAALRAKRLALCAWALFFIGVLAALSLSLIPFERYWARQEMKSLPPPTERAVSCAQFLRSPVGIAAWAAAYLSFTAGVLGGRCDSWLRDFKIAVLVLILGAGVLFLAAICLPAIRTHGPMRPLIE
jgi:hypothetical protein